MGPEGLEKKQPVQGEAGMLLQEEIETTPEDREVLKEITPEKPVETPAQTATETERLQTVRENLARVVPEPRQEAVTAAPENPLRAASNAMLSAQKSVIESERAKYSDPKERARAEKRIQKAIGLVQQGKLDKADRIYHGGVLREVIAAEMKLLAANGDFRALKRIGESNSLLNIYPENLELLPKEVIASPKIQNKIWKRMENALFGRGAFAHRAGGTGFDDLQHYRERGLLTPHTLEKMVGSRNFQNRVARHVKGIFERQKKGYVSSDPAGNARQAAQEFLDAGLITPQQAEAAIRKIH